MGLDTDRKLGADDPDAARPYLDEHFGSVFAEAIAEFSRFGYLAITIAALARDVACCPQAGNTRRGGLIPWPDMAS